MKKIVFIIVIYFISLSKVSCLDLQVDVTADAVILFNQDSNQVIYEKNADTTFPLASLTKMMTAYTVINNVSNLNKQVIIKQRDFDNLLYYTKAGLVVGDKVTYEDLLYAMMLPSGADASLALANNTSKNEKEFVKLMNEETKKLGLRNTTFADSYGGSELNKATAREVLRFTKEALANKQFEKYLKQQQRSYPTVFK